MLSRCAFLAVLTAAAVQWSAPSHAQRMQPRCEGWPGNVGFSPRPAMLVGSSGATCYGALLQNIRPACQLLATKVVQQPGNGRLQLVGLLDFGFVPHASSVISRAVVAFDWQCGGRRTTNRMTLHTATREGYAAAGGTSSSPPPGYGRVSR